MRVIDLSPPLTDTAGSAAAPLRGAALLVSVLLAISGMVRGWQAARVATALETERRVARLDLETVPKVLGPWRGETFAVDDQIARTTGADQIVTRRYMNENTGSVVELILLHGPAADVFIHSPEVCYPSAGYELDAGPEVKRIDGVPFRALAYRKGEGLSFDFQEVYYSWRYGGVWSPEAGIRKRFERIPGMYKVHVARKASPRERRDIGNPCEGFLSVLTPVLRGLLEALPK